MQQILGKGRERLTIADLLRLVVRRGGGGGRGNCCERGRPECSSDKHSFVYYIDGGNANKFAPSSHVSVINPQLQEQDKGAS